MMTRVPPDGRLPRSLFRLRHLNAVLLGLGFAAGVGCGSEPSGTQFRSLGTGVAYRNERVPKVPWSIHVVRVARTNDELELVSTLARGMILGLSTLGEQVKAVPAELGRPIAAINGDFYVVDRGPYIGDPRGLQVTFGELVSAPVDHQPCFWIDSEGQPHVETVQSQFSVTWPDGQTLPVSLNEQRGSTEATLYTPRLGPSTRTSGGRELVLEHAGQGPWLPLQPGQIYTARVREVREAGDTLLSKGTMVLSLGSNLSPAPPPLENGTELKISTATIPSLHETRVAIGGGPALLRDGRPVPMTVPPGIKGPLPYQYRSMTERHPRSCIGWNRTHLFFVQVDGRQPGLSMGMTVAELADYFLKLGCTDAMNLDGGASSSIWLNGVIVNSPCHGRDRPIANGLVVLRKQNNRND